MPTTRALLLARLCGVSMTRVRNRLRSPGVRVWREYGVGGGTGAREGAWSMGGSTGAREGGREHGVWEAAWSMGGSAGVREGPMTLGRYAQVRCAAVGVEGTRWLGLRCALCECCLQLAPRPELRRAELLYLCIPVRRLAHFLAAS